METLTARNIHWAPTNFHEIILLFKPGETQALQIRRKAEEGLL